MKSSQDFIEAIFLLENLMNLSLHIIVENLGARTTLNILVLHEAKILIYIGIGGPLELITLTTSGLRSRLWESLF
jgi:hypothetical protein